MNTFQIIAVSAFALVLLSSTADAQCAGSGINLNNACSSFTSAVKSNADRIMSADCSTLQTELVKPEYGTPSDGCCSAAKTFFNANCACDQNTINQAALFFGYSQQQLNAAATASAVRCGSSGCGTKC